MASRTTVVIVNWNSAEFLDRLFHSLEICSPSSIVTIDNASSDNSLEILSKYPHVKTIQNHQNLGFGAAANQGFVTAETPFVLLLNADVEVIPDAINLLENFMDENQTTGIVAPQLLFEDRSLQPSCRSFPTSIKLFLYLSYLDHVFPSNYRLTGKMHQTTREVDQPMGAAMLLRKSALNDAEGFDERFFLYMEDVDLCERMKHLGWKVFYYPPAKMIHHAGGSSQKDWERSQQNYLESVIRYFKKKEGPSKILLVRLLLSSGLIIRSLITLFLLRPSRAAFYLKMSVKILRLE
jgi:GT2 family glycosyltransferase